MQQFKKQCMVLVHDLITYPDDLPCQYCKSEEDFIGGEHCIIVLTNSQENGFGYCVGSGYFNFHDHEWYYFDPDGEGFMKEGANENPEMVSWHLRKRIPKEDVIAWMNYPDHIFQKEDQINEQQNSEG